MKHPLVLLLAAGSCHADVARIELRPVDVASTNTGFFTARPTNNPALFLGSINPSHARAVTFNTAPDGPLVEGGTVSNQYASLGVTMNNIRISGDIYGGNLYGAGFAAEYDFPQVYTFSSPVAAVGIVNTSPDRDLLQFWSGPNATGTLLLEFRDQETVSINFNIDRFVGGVATEGETIRSFVVSNASGNLELDELVFVLACPADFDTNGTLNFFDVSAFISAYLAAAPQADFVADGNFNFFDVSAFVTAYTSGCP